MLIYGILHNAGRNVREECSSVKEQRDKEMHEKCRLAEELK